MEIINVQSTMINAIGYDEANSVLQIKFKSDNSVWHYYDVAQHVFEEFRYADSKGKFFHRRIKNQYPESRIS